MATTEQKKELVEELKGPHYYRIMLSGYGAECSYMNISKEAFDFWYPITKEHGDSNAVHYVTSSEDKSVKEVNEDDYYEEIEAKDIPKEAMFMHDDTGEVGASWYEPINEFEHTYGITLDSAYLTIDKVDSNEYMAKHVEDIVGGQDLSEWMNETSEKFSTDDEYVECYDENHEYGDRYPEKGSHICQFYSAEKGTFFDAILTTTGLFDPKKLKFSVAEAPNGEDLVWAVKYDGEELSNDGGDTNGKGYYCYFYKQEY
jgi:hypothetical protein